MMIARMILKMLIKFQSGRQKILTKRRGTWKSRKLCSVYDRKRERDKSFRGIVSEQMIKKGRYMDYKGYIGAKDFFLYRALDIDGICSFGLWELIQ